jgi:hypothetical protein
MTYVPRATTILGRQAGRSVSNDRGDSIISRDGVNVTFPRARLAIIADVDEARISKGLSRARV